MVRQQDNFIKISRTFAEDSSSSEVGRKIRSGAYTSDLIEYYSMIYLLYIVEIYFGKAIAVSIIIIGHI